MVEETQEELFGVDALRDAWPVLDAQERLDGFRALPRDEAEDFFLELSTRGHVTLFSVMNARERRVWLRFLPPDDVADVLHEFEPEVRAEMLGMLEEATRREVVALLAYAEDEAGGLMNPRFARVRPEMKVEEAIRYVRRQAKEHLETIYYVYVLDAQQHLLGVVSFRELLLAPGDKSVQEVMHTDVISVPEEMDQEAVARLIAKHDILAVPVLDSERRVKGIVTVDDVVDVVETEATEDIQKIGGTAALDAPYLQTGVLGMVKKRAGWLMILLVGEMLTTTALASYEKRFASVLIILMPLIISAGGNSGSQATTLVVRAMALDEVRLRDWWRILRRELASGLILGVILALVGLLRIALGHWLLDQYTDHYLYVGLTVGASLVGVVTLGTLIGSLLPLFLRALKLDPASASAPMVATLLDVSGVLIYFTIAQYLLEGRLL